MSSISRTIPRLPGLATLTRNVAYKTGADNLVMDIISPQSTGDDDDRRYPTVVFVQGSAWTTPGIATTRSRSSRLWPAKALWWLR